MYWQQLHNITGWVESKLKKKKNNPTPSLTHFDLTNLKSEMLSFGATSIWNNVPIFIWCTLYVFSGLDGYTKLLCHMYSSKWFLHKTGVEILWIRNYVFFAPIESWNSKPFENCCYVWNTITTRQKIDGSTRFDKYSV